MPIPSLPTWQDCHELWSKRRRRQLREHVPISDVGTNVQQPGPPQLTSNTVISSTEKDLPVGKFGQNKCV